MPQDKASSQSTSQHGSSHETHGKAQSPSKRFVFNAWGDSIDRDLCALALTAPPETTPIAGRTGVATAEWVIVGRNDGRELICNRLHEGPCAWPWAVEAS